MPTHLPAPSSPRFHSQFETLISALMIGVAIAFLAFMLMRTGTGRLGSYELTVRMPDAGGLVTGTDVRLAGVKVGSISNLSLNRSDYAAEVRIRIRDDLFLPLDSIATISYPTMGDVYLSITPGRDARRVPRGGRIDQLAKRLGRAGV